MAAALELVLYARLSRRRQSPWHGNWEGGREASELTWGKGSADTPALRKRRSRGRSPRQHTPPPPPNRHPPPCPPDPSAVSNASSAGFITPYKTTPRRLSFACHFGTWRPCSLMAIKGGGCDSNITRSGYVFYNPAPIYSPSTCLPVWFFCCVCVCVFFFC